MSAAYWSGQVARMLSEARSAHSRRVVELNKVARGEARLTPDQQSQLKHSERRIATLLGELSDGVATRMREVTMEEVASEREALPRALRESYEQLYCAAYGSDPAVSVGDAAVIRGIGKREARTSTGTPEGRGGAAAPATKKFGQGNRNVIKDRRAYDMKLKIDRRLRRLSKEIEEHLAGTVSVFRVNVCSHCARVGEDDWRWCPNCGAEMKQEERE